MVCLSGAGLKVGVPLLPGGETLVLDTPLTVGHRTVGRVFQVLCLMWRSCSASFSEVFVFGGKCSTCGCRFGMSVGGGEFRIFLHCHPAPEPALLFK